LTLCIRRGTQEDLPEVAAIQAACPGAAQWNVGDYLRYDLVIAVWDSRVVGFAVMRPLAANESELLNVAVDPKFRRRGIGRRLIAECTSRHTGTVWLEVRERNSAARNFYQHLGFAEAGRRPDYYREGGDAAIVMKFHSC
jgi:[ribosomal protein S18]-alanine N-acetyltransferase